MGNGIEAICGYAGCEVTELNVQKDHVHLENGSSKGIDVGFDGAS